MAVAKVIWKILLDFIVLACVAVPLLVILLVAEPYHRGYFADDISLKLPFKEQTISEGLLAGVGFALNVLTILIIEIVRDKNGNGIGEKFISGTTVPGWVWETYTSVGVFTFGAACQQLTVNSAKYVIGRLRPHFFDVCRPIVNNSSLNALGYIQDFRCVGADAARLKDMRLSFPSAHSSFAMYSAVFFIFYVQVKGKWRGSKLLRHGIQFAALMGAWYVGLSRVVEHMHHWSDVAVGFAVGALYGAIVVCRPIVNNSSLNALGYIQDFRCVGADAARLKDMRLSFPSAHSSFAMYSAVFFIFYVQVKGKWRGSKLLRHGIQFAALMGAWYVGLSRVVEHMHHWSDVAVGFAVGALYGAIVFIYVLKPKKYGEPSWEPATPQMLPRPVLAL